jgi:UDPglucose 6-dehydrogenase
MNICIVGVGYVGLVSVTCFAEFGYNIFCVDNDEEKIKSLTIGGVIPFYEPSRMKARGFEYHCVGRAYE